MFISNTSVVRILLKKNIFFLIIIFLFNVSRCPVFFARHTFQFKHSSSCCHSQWHPSSSLYVLLLVLWLVKERLFLAIRRRRMTPYPYLTPEYHSVWKALIGIPTLYIYMRESDKENVQVYIFEKHLK